jgi:arylsulfatase A-like enzyme
MNRRVFLKLLGSSALSVLTPSCLTTSRNTTHGKPNILIFLTDDQGYADLGCYGSPDIRTPNIDSIAAKGVRFTSGYVTAPQCSPSRAGLISGRYQQRFGLEMNVLDDPTFGLPSGIDTFGNYMRRAGYATGAFGKWHLGNMREECRAINRGFDFVWSMPGEKRNELAYRGESLRNDSLLPYSTHKTHYLTEGLIHFIEKNTRADKPWFAYMAYHVPHEPFHTTSEFLARNMHVTDSARRVLAGMLTELDDSVGKVLAKLRRLRTEENTLIFFLSDNGAQRRPDMPFTAGSNGPLRGKKGSVFEGGIRVPFLVQWVGHVPAAQVLDCPVSSLDILPTALAAAGRTPTRANLDGIDILPLLSNRELPPERSLYWRWWGQMAVRRGDWKLVSGALSRHSIPARHQFGLFNVAADVTELNDMAADRPDLVRSLSAELMRWNDTLVRPGWISEGARKKLQNLYGGKAMKPYRPTPRVQ